MRVQASEKPYINTPMPNLKVCAGYKKYNDYDEIYCLDSHNCLLGVLALGKYKIRFTMPQYNFSKVLLLSLETAIANLKSGGD
jgi:hypothetical protein